MTPALTAPKPVSKTKVAVNKPAAVKPAIARRSQTPSTSRRKTTFAQPVNTGRQRLAATVRSVAVPAPTSAARSKPQPVKAARVAPRKLVAAPALSASAKQQPAKPATEKAPAPAAKAVAPPKDLDDLPLSSVLSKNTAGEGKSQRSVGNLFADVLTKLGFVILLGLGAAAGWKKFQGQSFAKPAKPQQTAEVASVLPLGPQRSVHLLKIGNQTLVVASTPQNISLLATLEGEAESGEGGVSGHQDTAGFHALLTNLINEEEPPTGVESPPAPEAVEPLPEGFPIPRDLSLFQLQSRLEVPAVAPQSAERRIHSRRVSAQHSPKTSWSMKSSFKVRVREIRVDRTPVETEPAPLRALTGKLFQVRDETFAGSRNDA